VLVLCTSKRKDDGLVCSYLVQWNTLSSSCEIQVKLNFSLIWLMMDSRLAGI